jgi:CRP-like cAMP-binding protein
MFESLIGELKEQESRWDEVSGFFHPHSVPPGTLLLREGEVADRLHFIRKGCLRMWFNNDGIDITIQFFFENQGVSSIESFWWRHPSRFNLQSIEATDLISISRKDFDSLLAKIPKLKDGFLEIALERMSNYANLFLSRIRDSPRKRYEDLLAQHPEIICRIPQHYIASYLGITPISLSRIRNRK